MDVLTATTDICFGLSISLLGAFPADAECRLFYRVITGAGTFSISTAQGS